MYLTQISKDFDPQAAMQPRILSSVAQNTVEYFRWIARFFARALMIDRLPVNERILRDMGITPAEAGFGNDQICSTGADGHAHRISLPVRPTTPLL